MFKKVLVVVAAMVMLATGVLAYTATVNGITWKYTVSDGKASISYMPTSLTGAITIPSSLGGYPVTSIGDYAFSYCSRLTSVTIPDSLASIGDYAFAWCSALTSMTIPDSVTSIGDYAFYDCSNLTSIKGSSVRRIGSYAFTDCISLTDVGTLLCRDIDFLGESIFRNCTSLKSIELWTIDVIPKHMFDGCISLKEATGVIPNYIKYVDDYAFNGCVSLESCVAFASYGLQRIGYKAFAECESLKSIHGSGLYNTTGIERIEKYAFWGCRSLRTLNFSQSIQFIGDYAFANCTNLEKVSFASTSNTNLSIGFQAFASCQNLWKVYIGARHKARIDIYNQAFASCPKLWVFEIGSSNVSINYIMAFIGSYKLKEIDIGGIVKDLYGNPISTKKNYKVAFYANGGKGSMSAQSMTYNKAAYLKKNAFKRTGYTFLGWAKTKTGAVVYKNAAAVKNLSASGATIKLYAKWAKTKYKIAYYANDGKGSMSAQSMTYNKAAYLKKNTFKRTGYTFQGWAKTKTGSVVYTNGKAVKNLSTSGATIKLYAKWAKTKYKIAFYANGGKGSMSAQSMAYNKAAYLKKNTFKRTGYTFQGWAKSAKGAVVYKNGKAVKNLRSTAGTVKLYAKWKPITYKIAFNANGGKGSMATKGMTYNKAAYLSKNAFKRSGYIFLGWAKSKNGAVAYKNAQAVKNLRSTTGTIKLYAVWAKTTYKVAFYANGGSGSMSAQTMTYNKAAYLKKNAFKRTGYTFAGWAKSSTGSVVYSNGKAVKNLTRTGGTVKLYAKWTPITYKVTFYPNGGTGSAVTQTMTYNKAANLRSNTFKRTGYAFAGWAKSTTGPVVYSNGQSVKNLSSTNSSVNLYAVWENWEKRRGVQLWEDGPYWAETNIGAENPEDYGYYFWWGDTIGYKRENNKWVASDGSLSNFSFTYSNVPTYGESDSTLQSEGWITSNGVLAPEHDAARAHRGSNWRMPTNSELQALFDNCTLTWTTTNGVNGHIVSGNGAYSRASIFLPAAGLGSGTSLYSAGSCGDYWSSVPCLDCNFYSWFLGFTSCYNFGVDSGHFMDDGHRYYGRPVRPVSDVQ